MKKSLFWGSNGGYQIEESNIDIIWLYWVYDRWYKDADVADMSGHLIEGGDGYISNIEIQDEGDYKGITEKELNEQIGLLEANDLLVQLENNFMYPSQKSGEFHSNVLFWTADNLYDDSDPNVDIFNETYYLYKRDWSSDELEKKFYQAETIRKDDKDLWITWTKPKP